jgi:hypothetical protein
VKCSEHLIVLCVSMLQFYTLCIADCQLAAAGRTHDDCCVLTLLVALFISILLQHSHKVKADFVCALQPYTPVELSVRKMPDSPHR